VVKKGVVRIRQGHCNLWLGLIKNTILKTDLVLDVRMQACQMILKIEFVISIPILFKLSILIILLVNCICCV